MKRRPPQRRGMTDRAPDPFDKIRLPPALDEYLRNANPWWESLPGRVLPSYRRWAFAALLRKLEAGLAPAVLLRGTRQVGKTTLLEQVIQHLLRDVHVEPRRILRVQFDEIPSLKGLDEPVPLHRRMVPAPRPGLDLQRGRPRGEPCVPLLRRGAEPGRLGASDQSARGPPHGPRRRDGSSALRIEAGRDSLARPGCPVGSGHAAPPGDRRPPVRGQIEPLLPPNGLEDLLRQDFWRQINANGDRHRWPRDEAFRAFSERGGYPIAHARGRCPGPKSQTSSTRP